MDIHPFTILVETLQSYAMHGGYVFLLVTSILEAIPLLGTTIPGHTIVILSGFFARIGIFNLWTVIAFATLGAVLGDMIGFSIGKKYGTKFIENNQGRMLIKKEYIDRARGLIARHTGKALIFGRFNPLTRAFMPLLVGASHAPAARFWVYNLIGGALWATASVMVGYVFGMGYHAAAAFFGKAAVIVTIVALISIWGYSFVNTRFHVFKKYELFMLALNILSLWGLVETIQDASSAHSFMANFDVYVNLFISQHVTPLIITLAKIMTNVGSSAVTGLLGVVIAAMLLYRRKWRSGAIMFLSVFSTGVAVELLKALFLRERPVDAVLLIVNDPSFPSGHASMAAALFVIIAYLLAPRIHFWVKREVMIVLCVLAIVVIGFSRIVLSVHWASDVIGGWSLGLFCASASILLVRYVGALILNRVNIESGR